MTLKDSNPVRHKCQICGDEFEYMEEIETPNCIFNLCLECAIDVEGKIEEMIKYDKEEKARVN